MNAFWTLIGKGGKELIDLFRELTTRIIYKVTSGKFIFTIVVASIYAKLALDGSIEVERVQEITLVVLYAYFTRKDVYNGEGDSKEPASSKKTESLSKKD